MKRLCVVLFGFFWPSLATAGDFVLPIENVFSVSGRGTVVAGRVEAGSIRVGDTVDLVGLGKTGRVKVTNIQVTNTQNRWGESAYATTGNYVGLALAGVSKSDVRKGQVVVSPGRMAAHRRFSVELIMLTKERGGRHTPISSGYRPVFRIRTADVTGQITLGRGGCVQNKEGYWWRKTREGDWLPCVQMARPGDKVFATVELVTAVGVDVGTQFRILEGGHTVGWGSVVALR